MHWTRCESDSDFHAGVRGEHEPSSQRSVSVIHPKGVNRKKPVVFAEGAHLDLALSGFGTLVLKPKLTVRHLLRFAGEKYVFDFIALEYQPIYRSQCRPPISLCDDERNQDQSERQKAAPAAALHSLSTLKEDRPKAQDR